MAPILLLIVSVQESRAPAFRATAVLVAPALVIVLTGLHFASKLVVCTLLGAMIAIAVEPLGRALQRRGFPSYGAAAVNIGAVLVATAGVGALVGHALQTLSENFAKYQRTLLAFRYQFMAWLRNENLNSIVPVVRKIDVQDEAQATLVSGILGTANTAGNVILVLLVTSFILFEAATFQDKLSRITNGGRIPRLAASQAVHRVQRYLIVKTCVSVATGLLVGGLTYVLDLSSPVLWGLLAFAFNYVPFIGSLVAAIPAVLIATVELGLPEAFTLGVGYLVINVVVGNIIEPAVLGRTLGLSPLVVLLSVALWGVVLGPVGALLSVPITMVAKIVFEHSERYQWVAVLLAQGRPYKAPPGRSEEVSAPRKVERPA